MKIYKDDVQLIIDGETDLCLGRKRFCVVDIGKKVDNITLLNWTIHCTKHTNIILRKLWGIWQVIKYF